MSLILPSYQSGFAPRDYEPAYPSLWQGCVAAYATLLGPTGLVLRDSVGKNDGVLTGGPTWDISGGRYALGFDGSSDYVSLSSPIFTRPQSIPTTISYWVRVTDISAYRTIAATFNANNGWQTNIEPTTARPGFSWVRTGSGVIGLRSTTGLTVNSWSHVAIRYDGTGKNGLSFYVNGIGPTATTDESTIASFADVTNSTMYLGARPIPDLYHQGNLDDIRIYSRYLSESEILLLARRRGIAYEPRPRRKWYFRGFSPKKKLLEAKITSTVPGSYQTGYAPRDGEPVYPELWKGCVGAWSAGLGPSGLTLRDNSPAKNHGTLVNGPTYQVSGGQYALSFDGSNDYVSIASLTPALGFSFACWFKASNASRIRQSIFSNSTTDQSPDIYLHLESISGATNAMNFYNGGAYIGASTTFTQDTNWHHYAWTTDLSGKVRYYRDGIFLSSPGLSWTPLNDSSANASIGAVVGLLGSGFTAEGQIDDCRRYSRTLTDSEIRLLASQRNIAYAHRKKNIAFRAYDPIKQVGVGKITSIIQGGYHTGVGGVNNEPAYPELTKGLVGGWCPSLGVTGGLLRDNSGQGNHGVLTGMDPGTDWVVSGGKYALDFDGVDDYVSADVLPNAEEITVAGWYSYTGVPAGNNGIILAKGSLSGDSTSTFALYYNRLQGWSFFVVDANNNLTIVRSLTLGESSRHIHVAGVSSKQKVSLYVNGMEAASTSGTTVKSSAHATYIGGGLSIPANYVTNGSLDDIRFYNRPLSPNEIRLLASRRGIGYDYKTHRSYSKTQSSGLRKRILTGLP